MDDSRAHWPEHFHHHSDFGEGVGVAVTLVEKPLTREDIKEQLTAFARRFGFLGSFGFGTIHHGREFDDWLRRQLDELMQKGWVVKEGSSYALTQEGRRKASLVLDEIRSAKERVAAFASPQNVSKLTLVVHLALAAVKLPAALISGSVGLLNDAIDTLLDGASSLMVYWGLRRDREILVSRLLVLFMLGTGLFALYEAVMRIVHQRPVRAEGFTFAVVLVSAAVCTLLWLVQRFIGLRRGSLALITQSVDSRNHVIVAASVTAGLIAAALHFPWLDYLVGLAVAALIVKSAVELAVELIRAGNEEVELDKYQFWFYERFRSSQLCRYMLYLVKDGRATTRAELLAAVEQAFDFRDNVLLRTVGLDQRPHGSTKLAAACYERLLENDLLREDDRLLITEPGLHRLASNRFFVTGEGRTELRRSARIGLRVSLSLIGRWILFCGLVWIGKRYVLPLLPAFPLWDSLDRRVTMALGLPLSMFELLHLVAGFALATWSTVRMPLIHARHFTWRERKGKTAAALKTSGFFAKVRHPLTGSAFLYTLGLLLAFCSGWALIPLALSALFTVVSVLREERRDLAPRFGDAYRRYAAKVRRRLFTPFQTAVLVIAGMILTVGLIF